MRDLVGGHARRAIEALAVRHHAQDAVKNGIGGGLGAQSESTVLGQAVGERTLAARGAYVQVVLGGPFLRDDVE
ncbi:hypothetical protein D3C87_1896970 [compost metagenome]